MMEVQPHLTDYAWYCANTSTPTFGQKIQMEMVYMICLECLEWTRTTCSNHWNYSLFP